MGFLAQTARQIGSGDRSPVDLVRSCLDAIKRQDKSIRAWAHLNEAGALARAEELAAEVSRRGPRSALHGIPVGVKDIFDTEDMPTEWGAEIYQGRRPAGDAALVAELRRLGAVVIGKTQTTAFAYFDPGPTRNPHHLEHTPGGSSSGSAAAVAAGMAPAAVGSQTMGSVLRPASFCGVTGFKPTFGALPLDGVLPFAPSLDHAGLFTDDAADMVFFWQALIGKEIRSERLGEIAALSWPPVGRLEPAMETAFQTGVETLRGAGLHVTEIRLPGAFWDLPDAILAVLAWEAAEVHRERYERYGDRIGAKLAELVRRGLSTPSLAYDEAREAIREAARAYEEFCQSYPITLTPAALGPAPFGLASTGDPRANAPWTAIGVPAVAIRLGRTPDRLPLGLQITAWRGRDDLALSAAVLIERALRSGRV